MTVVMRTLSLVTIIVQTVVIWQLLAENRESLALAHRLNDALATSTQQLQIDAQALHRCTELLKAQQVN